MLGSVTGLQSYNTHQSIGRQAEQLDTEAVDAVEQVADQESRLDQFSLSGRRLSYLAIANQFDVTSMSNEDFIAFRGALFQHNLIDFPQANVMTLAAQGAQSNVDLNQALTSFFSASENAKFLPQKDALLSMVGNLTAAREEIR